MPELFYPASIFISDLKDWIVTLFHNGVAIVLKYIFYFLAFSGLRRNDINSF